MESIGQEQLKLSFIKLQQKTYIDNVISESDYEYFKECLKNEDEMLWYFVIRFMAATGARVSEFGNNNQVEHIAEQKAKVVLQEMHGKDFSEYEFRDACIKVGTQLQSADKDRSYERGVRIR